jgi:putative glutamine amidotransferase
MAASHCCSTAATTGCSTGRARPRRLRLPGRTRGPGRPGPPGRPGRAVRPVVGVTAWASVLRQPPSDFRYQTAPENYLQALRAAGLAPLLIPVDSDPGDVAGLLDRVDGLVLTGGGDVDPAQYAAARLPPTDDVDSQRDQVEIALIRLARQRDVPALAICRGIQVVNVALGGTLTQDLPTADPPRPGHLVLETWDGPTHPVRLEPGSLLHRLLGPEIGVNSLHHQAISRLAPDLRVAGRAPDGVIEAVECDGARFLVAVQWHPEMLGPAHVSAALFGQLAAAIMAATRSPVYRVSSARAGTA